jgi:hypothetical protein
MNLADLTLALPPTLQIREDINWAVTGTETIRTAVQRREVTVWRRSDRNSDKENERCVAKLYMAAEGDEIRSFLAMRDALYVDIAPLAKLLEEAK